MKRWMTQSLGLVLVSAGMTAYGIGPTLPPPPPPTPPGYEETEDPAVAEQIIRELGANLEKSVVEQFLVETTSMGPMQRVSLFRTRFAPSLASPPSGPGSDTPESAGGLNFSEHMKNVQFSLEGTVGYLEDQQLGGNGKDYTLSAFMTAMWNDETIYGFGLTGNRTRLEDKFEIDQLNYTMDMFISRTVWDNLSIGAFASYTYSDLDDAILTINGRSVPIGEVTNRFGAGVMANYWKEYKGNTVSLSTSLSSQNNYNLAGFFDSEDTVWVSQLEVSRPITEQLDAAVFTTFFRSFDNDSSSRDMSHGSIGGELGYQVNERTRVAVGYERSLFYDAYEDHRFSASVSVNW